MDEEPMWAADRIVASTLYSAITIPDTVNEFAIKVDLGASINLMPYSLYAKLSLETLKPTKMSVRLADQSFKYPVGIAENMLVEVGKFTLPVDFVILEIDEDNSISDIDVIDEILKEDFDALLNEGSKILHSIEGTILEEKLFAEFDEFMPINTDEDTESKSDTEEPPFEKITFNTDYKIKTSLEEPPTDLELEPLPDNLEYKRGIKIVANEKDELVPTRTVTCWCMLAIFHDMIEESVEVFIEDFSVFGNSFDNCLNNLDKMLQRCEDAHLVLNGEKCHFMVKEGLCLDTKCPKQASSRKAKIDVISKLPPPLILKAKAQALPTNDARVVITFLKKLFCHFRMPKALISDRGTHFCNKIMEKTMKGYGVNHRFSTSYHPQTSGQVENTNKALKRILEKTVKDNPVIWSRKLDDALWAFCTAFKTPTGTTSYKLIYGKNCHMSFEIKHRAYWALKNCNPDLIATGEKITFQLHKLDKLRHQAYENSRLYKARTKVWHDKKLKMRKEFKHRNKVLLFHSNIKTAEA
nr:reverse transcriptase domain-containing protein [Tanacetum cinerariifolium]